KHRDTSSAKRVLSPRCHQGCGAEACISFFSNVSGPGAITVCGAVGRQYVSGGYSERLSREKRVLLTRSEEVRLERRVLTMAEKLQTSVKLSHLMRATLTLLQYAEAELLRQCELAQAMKRPHNNSPGELLAFEGAIAEMVHRALRAASPFSEEKDD